MHISIDSIAAMSADERAEALTMLEGSLVRKTSDGQKMIAMLQGLDTVTIKTADGKEVILSAGPDGKFGTEDDVATVQ